MLASVGVFFASVSLSPLDKEMKCCPAQGLMELSKKLRHITSANEGRTAPAPSASDKTLLPRTGADETEQETPASNPRSASPGPKAKAKSNPQRTPPNKSLT